MTLAPTATRAARRGQPSEFRPRRPAWRRKRERGWALQAAVALALAAAIVWLIGNVAQNLPRSNLGFGFDFLELPTRFEIGSNYLNATARDPVWMAFMVGAINTVRVSAVGIVLCVFLGFTVALARLSRNWLISRFALIYVETVRNVPLLLQMLFWYAFSTLFPLPRDAWEPLQGVFVTNRGIFLPALDWTPGLTWVLSAFAIGVGATLALVRHVKLARERTGRPVRIGIQAAALLLGLPTVVAVVAVPDLSFSRPELKGFNFQGGGIVTPEFVAVLISLSVYQSGFAAETIRSGILGVKKGQIEAARSLGLSPRLVLLKIVLPQALRIIVPPMTSQFLSLTKNSSLAVVIGYPELVRVSTAVTSETGRAIECVGIMMSIYLGLSLLTSAFMNWYNTRIAYAEA